MSQITMKYVKSNRKNIKVEKINRNRGKKRPKCRKEDKIKPSRKTKHMIFKVDKKKRKRETKEERKPTRHTAPYCTIARNRDSN